MAGAPVGNKNAAKNKLFDDELRKYLVQNPEKRMRIIANIVETACESDTNGLNTAFRLLERVDGKVKDSVELTGADGDQLLSGITVTFVTPKKEANES